MQDIDVEESNFSIRTQETLQILVYSDVFQYPLTKKEIYERGKITVNELELCLNKLIQENKLYLINGFYTLHNDNQLVSTRLKRNQLAKKFMTSAILMTKIIANFPFIRGVFLSGSMSKECMDEDSDIDFFIITSPKRLWVSHLFCSLFKKIFLLNERKYFCYNYFIDSEHLKITNKSIYTAIELKTLIPLYGYSYYKQLQDENNWATDFFPNYPLLKNNDVFTKQTYFQKTLEFILDNKLGDWIDQRFLNWSVARRRKKLDPKLFQNADYYTNLQSYVAKAHITDTHPNIINEYAKKLQYYSYFEADK
ncbi:hypothetical protein GCM10028808_00410 [Spirosoma migulaei]